MLIIEKELIECTVEPDELSYLFDIINPVIDYFSSYDINFIVTNNARVKLPSDGVNILFLTGVERDFSISDKNYRLCFTNFWRFNSDTRIKPLPLGVNKFLNRMIYNVKKVPFYQREFDIFFSGFIHPTRIKFLQTVEKLKCHKRLFYTHANNLQKFNENTDPRKYINIASNAKIMLAPMGAHHSTSYRYFESIYLDSIVIYEKNENQNTWFETNNPLGFAIDNWGNLTEKFIKDAIDQYNDKYFDFLEYKKDVTKYNISKYIIEEIKNVTDPS